MISWRFTLMQSWKSKCASFWFQSTTFLIEILGSMRNCCKEKMIVRNLAAVAQMVARGVQMTWARQFPAVYFAPMMMMESWMIVFSWFIFQDQVHVSTIMIHFMSPTITSMVNILLIIVDASVIAWVVRPVISNQSSFMCLKSGFCY